MPNSASLGKLANKRSAKQQRAAWRDYYEMTKPNVVLLLLLQHWWGCVWRVILGSLHKP